MICVRLFKRWRPSYLSYELLVFGDSPGLHDADDGGLYQEFPVLLDVLVSHLHLLLLLSFHGDVDVDPQLLVLVLLVQLDHRRVVQVRVTTGRSLVHGPCPGSSSAFVFQLQQLGFEQYLEDLHQDLSLDLGAVFEFLQRPRVRVVVLQQDGQLERRGLQRVPEKVKTVS